MSFASLSRHAVRQHPKFIYRLQPSTRRLPSLKGRRDTIGCYAFTTSANRLSGAEADQEESFEEFTARYEKEFDGVQDVFELQRNLNNAFAYDLVPSVSVIAAALKAARRVNDFPTAVRIFEGIKVKVENKHQYQEYLSELKSLREELGVSLKEDLYPGVIFSSNRDKENWLPESENPKES
ncbi:MAG: Cytochrome c oxidase subunit 6 [Heterodermia speciosa]|uniref:Cytochrome c oxidase subunit 6, mitochondrial n=1 Tax=Heterodermia speciosa TaxID=116794 RepID=A0A8H3J2S7_9LECA|nr:MAG: Cytochrome c oxidase subunit 6 [Heterodermia speciosa]